MEVGVELGCMLAMGAQRVLSMERAVSSESDTNLGDLLPDQGRAASPPDWYRFPKKPPAPWTIPAGRPSPACNPARHLPPYGAPLHSPTPPSRLPTRAPLTISRPAR